MFSPFMYFKNNKKSAAIVISILSLSVFCIYYISTLIASVYTTSKVANTSLFEKFSLVTYVGESENVKESKKLLLDKIGDECQIYDTYISFASIKTVFGTTSAYLLFFENQDNLQDIFNKYNLSLTGGNMPSLGEKELILHENILKNKNLSVGDTVGEFVISGSFKGDVNVGLGYMNGDMRQAFDNLNPSYLIYSSEGLFDQLNSDISKLDEDNWDTYTYTKMLDKLDEEFETTNIILLIVVIMMSFCLSIAVAAMMFSIYAGRYNEFAILNAIGYKKKSIHNMIISENIILSVLSWCIGFLLSLMFLFLTNKLIYEGMGQQMSIINEDSIRYTLILPAVSVMGTVLPVLSKLSKTDLINIIEGRN